MKQLEAIGLIQFFLYERKDLELGWNTAFLGPNGTGKTALLDALQIVLLAADSNRTHFNASGEGKKRARGLRDYCLGIYGQTDAERYRTGSNTYINLIFRDQESGVPVTAGVSLAAQADNPDVVFNGLYILPGVALDTHAHVEREGGREVVLPWRRFQHVAGDMCRLAGTAPVFTLNREEFSRRLFVEHLATPGEKPNVRAIRSAFARSLKLNKDVTDLSETLRDHLIEQRLTNVRQFRARLDQFRHVRELIRQITERIERVSAVAKGYAVVQRERTAQANLDCLQAVYETERVGEKLAENEDRIESLTKDLESSRLALVRAEAEVREADAARERALVARNLDPDFQKQAGHAERLTDLEGGWKDKREALATALETAIAAAAFAGKVPSLDDQRGLFEDAVTQLLALKATALAAQLPPAEDIVSASRVLAEIHERVRRALSAAEDDHKAARDLRRDAKTAVERAQRGLTPLRESTLALQRLLEDGGIQATPVCDLVSITDPEWQPALEAYLASHVDALLVPREQELAAIDLYKGLKGAQRVYRVKLALPSRGRPWQAPGGGKYAAQLIAGESREAAWYLQGELGRLSLASSSQELQAGTKALSREGMVSSGGGVERLQLPAPNDLKIGRNDSGAQRQRAEGALHDAEAQLQMAEIKTQHLRAALPRLAMFADAEAARARLEALFSAARESGRVVNELRMRLSSSQTDQLATLQLAVEAAGHRSAAARDAEKALVGRVAGLDAQHETAVNSGSNLKRQLEVALAREASCRHHPLYDANEVERHRGRYDDRHGEDMDAKLHACAEAIRNAGTKADNADRDAWRDFSQYAADFQLQNHDISSNQWQRAYQYVLEDKRRLEEMELAERLAQAEEAYAAAVKVFRTDVAQTLLEGFEAIEEQINNLNQVLKSAPEFSNGERYQFKYKPLDQHRALYDFLKRVREQGEAEEDIFGGSGRVPEEFRALVEGDANSELLQESSPLNDHRRFFSYDVEIYHDGKSMGWLSKRFGPGSGGEHRTPLYVIFGAALAAAYGKARGTQTTGGIIMLDEAFEKMDAQNVRATAEYLNALGLQLIMAGPETDQPKMSSFLNVYYDMARFGSRTVQMTKNVVMDEARELLQSDNFLLHPELLAREMEALAETEDGARG
jgi:chromosome segregation protein